MEQYGLDIEKFERYLDENVKALVGILLKRFEILESQSISSDQLKLIYKQLVKEHLYENTRNVKMFFRVCMEPGKMIFTSKEK